MTSSTKRRTAVLPTSPLTLGLLHGLLRHLVRRTGYLQLSHSVVELYDLLIPLLERGLQVLDLAHTVLVHVLERMGSAAALDAQEP